MTLRSLRLCVPAALLSASCALAQSPEPAGQATPPPEATAASVAGDEVIPAFKISDMDIDGVIGLLEMLTGRSVMRPAALPPGNYTLHLKRPLPRSEAVAAIESILSLNGIAVAPLGDRYLKIVSTQQIRTEAPELLSVPANSLPPSGRVAAILFQPDHIRIKDFFDRAQALLSANIGGNVTQFPESNTALVIDTISNLQRLESLLGRLDKSAALPKFYTLKFAKASELAQKIQGILQNPTLQAQFGTSATYSADDRTNQIILVADTQQQTFFDELINRLDVKADPNTRTEVIYLKHAEAEKVATLLGNLITGQNSAAQKLGSAQVLANRAQPAQGQPQAVAAQPAATAGASTTFSSIITVIADERTNAVIVNGTMDDLRLVKELVDKVDIILAQVRIEVIIAEINLDDTEATGIDALQLDVQNNKLIGVAGSMVGAGLGKATSTDTASGATGLAAVNHLAHGYSLTGLLNLSSTPIKSRANILSVPTISTTHNKEAEIFVGESRPTISSYLNETTSTGTAGSGYRSTINKEQIGIKLKVTPLIGDDGSVQLEIEQEVNRVIGDIEIDGNSQAIVGERTTKSYITARSGEIIVLGGLQKTEESKSRNRLGPVPIIGDLLGKRKWSKTRTDLVFFLRPIVLTNTSADNVDALERIKALPNQKEVQKAINPGAPVEEDEEKSRPFRNRRK